MIIDLKGYEGAAVDFQDFFLRQAAGHMTGRRWGKAALTLAVTLLVGVAGTGAKLGVDAYEAHEARIVAVEKEETLQRQNQCHEVFNYIEDDTPNKQIDPQSQAKINSAVVNAIQNCVPNQKRNSREGGQVVPTTSGQKR